MSVVRLQELRAELKKWEHEFVAACDRKPDQRDAAARPEIAAKYREYECLKKALAPPVTISSVPLSSNVATPAPVRKKSAFGFTFASRLVASPATTQAPVVINPSSPAPSRNPVQPTLLASGKTPSSIEIDQSTSTTDAKRKVEEESVSIAPPVFRANAFASKQTNALVGVKSSWTQVVSERKKSLVDTSASDRFTGSKLNSTTPATLSTNESQFVSTNVPPRMPRLAHSSGVLQQQSQEHLQQHPQNPYETQHTAKVEPASPSTSSTPATTRRSTRHPHSTLKDTSVPERDSVTQPPPGASRTTSQGALPNIQVESTPPKEEVKTSALKRKTRPKSPQEPRAVKEKTKPLIFEWDNADWEAAPKTALQKAKDRLRIIKQEVDQELASRPMKRKNVVSNNFVKLDLVHRTKRIKKGNARTRQFAASVKNQRLAKARTSKAQVLQEAREKSQDAMYTEFLNPQDIKQPDSSDDDVVEEEKLPEFMEPSFLQSEEYEKVVVAPPIKARRNPAVNEEQHKRLLSAALRQQARRTKAQIQAEEHAASLAQSVAVAKQRRMEMTDNTSLPISHPKVVNRSLKEVFEFESFLPGQEEAITRVCSGESLLLVLPTGGGKSLCYQLPAFLFPGLTIVVAPLISLMQDQLTKLPPILTGAFWNSTMERNEVLTLMDQLRNGLIKVLYVSPEKLLSPGFWRFMASLPSPGVSFACVDEAHCISEWSHNFRPMYMRLRWVLQDCLRVRAILAITATATQQTARAICHSLGMGPCQLIRLAPHRANLALTVSREHDRDTALLSLLQTPKFQSLSSIIVYVMLQREADRVYLLLKSKGYHAQSYHAGKSAAVRKNIQDQFMCGRLQIIVATIAFGMGLDKSDVRAVIHYNTPRSFEHYVQEVGRAGRDGEPAFCHAFYSSTDVEQMQNLTLHDGVDREAVEHVVLEIFGTKDKPTRLERFVALPLADLFGEHTISEAAISTMLVHLELSREVGGHIQFVSLLHNNVEVGFFRTDPHVLANDNDVVQAILTQNGNRGPRQVGGMYAVDVCEVANALGVHVADVQRDLIKLKAKREISLEWKDKAFCIQVLRHPSSLDELVDGVHALLQRQEQCTLVKLSVLAEALSLVSTASFCQSNTHNNKVKTDFVFENSDDESMEPSSSPTSSSAPATLSSACSSSSTATSPTSTAISSTSSPSTSVSSSSSTSPSSSTSCVNSVSFSSSAHLPSAPIIEDSDPEKGESVETEGKVQSVGEICEAAQLNDLTEKSEPRLAEIINEYFCAPDDSTFEHRLKAFVKHWNATGDGDFAVFECPVEEVEEDTSLSAEDAAVMKDVDNCVKLFLKENREFVTSAREITSILRGVGNGTLWRSSEFWSRYSHLPFAMIFTVAQQHMPTGPPKPTHERSNTHKTKMGSPFFKKKKYH